MKKVWNALADALESLSRLGAIVAETALVVLLLLVFHEVIARYVLNKPTLYSVELSEYLLIVVPFLAAGWGLQEDKHVRMQSFTNLMSPRLQFLSGLFTSVIVLLFCLILVWQGGKSSLVALRGGYHSSSLLNFPLWIPYAIIPLGSLLLGLQMLVRIGRLIEHVAGAGQPVKGE